MSFWNSRTRIARIPHRCEYCGKQIEVGEQYSRETGIYEGEFNDYSLCSRCKGAWTYLSGEYCCPICGGFNLREYDFADDMLSVECQCDKCDRKYMVDLSEEAIKKHFNEIRGETS